MLPRDVVPAVKASCIGAGTAIAIVTGISTMFLYAAHGLPIWLALRSDEWRTARVWSRGRFSYPTPGNVAWPFMAVAMVFLALSPGRSSRAPGPG